MVEVTGILLYKDISYFLNPNKFVNIQKACKKKDAVYKGLYGKNILNFLPPRKGSKHMLYTLFFFLICK